MTATTAATRGAPAAADPTPSGAHPAPPAAPWDGLAAAAARAGVVLDAEQLARFDVYRRLLLEWNARFNLTAVTDPIEVERRLFLDALLLVPTVDGLVAAGDRDPPRLVDVGSGAGVPGLPLKIARPRLDVTLIEATGKKARFLAHVIAELGLGGAFAVHGRAEELAHDPAHRAAYDQATARAVASLPALLELCVPLLRVGGHALFPKGAAIAGELAAGERAAPLVGARVRSAEPVAPGTCLVTVAKVAPTPRRFPRRAGIPAREPLGGWSGDGPAADRARGPTRRPAPELPCAPHTPHPSVVRDAR